MGSRVGQIGRNVPRNTEIPREEASKSRKCFDKKRLHGGTPTVSASKILLKKREGVPEMGTKPLTQAILRDKKQPRVKK